MNAAYQPVKVHGSNGIINEQRIFRFANGRGASVVRGRHSYGGPKGLFELAVLNRKDDLDYSTPITEDVLGYLTEDDVQAALAQIDALPPESEES